MSCNEYEYLIQGYVDQTLTDEEKEQLNNHISNCESCKQDLHGMIEVVSFIEDMNSVNDIAGGNRKSRFSTKVLSTCVAVCSAMMFAFYFPYEYHFSEAISKFDQRNFILAAETEELPIPGNQNVILLLPRSKSKMTDRKQDFSEDPFDITWVYPSAYSHLTDFEWDNESEQYVLINIPDHETLIKVLALLNRGKLNVFQDQYNFPISVVIENNDRELDIQPLNVNIQGKEIRPLFEQLTKVSFQLSH